MACADLVAALPPPTALAVVDGPAWAALLDRVLQAHGFRTHRVLREAAPAMLAAWPYDLVVVTDPARDGLDAFVLVRWLRDADCGASAACWATVLVLSPGLSEKGRKLLARCGADGLLVGPLTEQRLGQALRVVWDGQGPSGGHAPAAA
jgi:DNA-binding response OmpR family regulator